MPIWNKINAAWITVRSKFQSIASCWPLLCWNKKRKNKLVTSLCTAAPPLQKRFFLRGGATVPVHFERRLQNVTAIHAGKVLYASCAVEHGALRKTNFIIKSKTSSRFPKFDCAWTLLPGSTWLQTPITRLYQLRSKLQNTFCFFKTCWWLTGLSRLYDAYQPPGRLQGT